jgi:SOS response regulatory protein OraA/RecX
LKNNLNRALAYCSRNIRAKSEVAAKIKSWKLDSDEEISILNFLDLHNFFFSDEEYLDKYLENLSSTKGYSKIQIKIKLLKKNLPKNLIEQKVSQYFKENENAEIEKYVKRNLRKIKLKPREVAIKFLISKGFNVQFYFLEFT